LSWTKDKSLPPNTKAKSWKMVEACGGGELLILSFDPSLILFA